MILRVLCSVAVLGSLCAIPNLGMGAEPAAPQSPDVSPVDLELALAQGIPLNPEVLAAQGAALAAKGRLAQNRLLSANPTVSASYAVVGERRSVSLQQPLNLGGVAPLERGLGRAELEGAEARLERARLEAGAAIRVAYVDALVAIGQREVAEEAVEVSERLRAAVAAKLEVGEASKLDLRLAILSQASSSTWLLDAQARESEVLRQLALHVQMPISAQALVGSPLDVAPWGSERPEGHPRADVRAAGFALDAADTKAHLAGRRGLPPITVGAFMEQEEGVTFAGPSLSFPIPLFARNQANVGAAEGERLVAEAQATGVKAKAEAEVLTAQVRLDGANKALEGLEEALLGEGQAALESIIFGYDAGELDLPTALLLQQQVLKGESAAITLLGQVAAARIDWALALELPALLGGE